MGKPFELMVNAKKHGGLFNATEWERITSDNFPNTKKIPVNNCAIKQME